MNCTAEGQAVTSVTPATAASGGRTVSAGRAALNQPRRLVYGRAKVGGLVAYMETSGTGNKFLHMIVILCDGPIHSLEKLFIGEEEVALTSGIGDGGFVGTGKFSKLTVYGATAHTLANLGPAAGGVGWHIYGSSLKWTYSHKLKGVAAIHLKFEDWDSSANSPSAALFDGSSPDISAVVKGCSDIYDPRTDTTGYSANAALCLWHYRRRMGAADLDLTSLADAADACDESTSYGPRYEVSGVVEMSASVEDVTRQFLAACSGTIQANGGTHHLIIGAQAPAPAAITWDDVREGFTIERTAGETTALSASYSGEDTGWQTTDAAIRDGGDRSLSLELVGAGEQAQQLAAEANRKQGPTERVSLALSPRHLDLIAGATVDVQLAPHLTGRFDVIASGFVFGLEPIVRVTLERQRSGLFDLIEPASRTPGALSLGPRGIASATLSPTPGGGKTFPLTVTVTPASPGVTVRWSTSAMPTSVTAGNAYFGSITLASAATLYVAQFRDGWTTATQSGAYS